MRGKTFHVTQQRGCATLNPVGVERSCPPTGVATRVRVCVKPAMTCRVAPRRYTFRSPSKPTASGGTNDSVRTSHGLKLTSVRESDFEPRHPVLTKGSYPPVAPRVRQFGARITRWKETERGEDNLNQVLDLTLRPFKATV